MKKDKITQNEFFEDFDNLSVEDFKKKYVEYFEAEQHNTPPIANVSSVFEPTRTVPNTDNSVLQPNQPYYGTQNMGWICPKCGSVHAPWVQTCPNCSSPVRPDIVWASDRTPCTGDPNFGRGQTISTFQANGATSCSISDKNQRNDVTRTKGKIYDPQLDFEGRPIFG